MAPRLTPPIGKSEMSRPKGTREAVLDSIQRFGLIFPILTTPDGQFVDGRMRADICKEIGHAYEPEIWKVGMEATLAHVIVEVSNEGKAEEINWDEQVAYLAGKGHTTAIIAAALGLKFTVVAEILVAQANQGEAEEKVPVRYIEHHEVLSYLPQLDLAQYEELKTKIRNDGLKEPVLVNSEGLLVDGRARWNICQELGITPVTRMITGNPWEQAILANVGRIPEQLDRIILAARMPARIGGSVLNDQRPPAMDFICEALSVPFGSVKPLRAVANAEGGGKVLFEAVKAGQIKPGTAKRIAYNVPARDWEKAIKRVQAAAANGVKPRLPEYASEIAKRTARGPIVSRQDRDHNRYVTAIHVDQAINNLIALGLIVDGTDQLEPSIDDVQAAELLRRLKIEGRAITRLKTLLQERKETTTP